MEPILLHGFPLGSSMGLVAAFEQVGQPYRLCRVDMLNEMKNDAYGRLNGRQETPVLITDKGAVLTETMAIAAWLAARDTKRRISFDPRSPQADRMHQLMAFVNTGFTAAFTPLWVALEAEDEKPETLALLRDFGRKSVAERHEKLEAMIGDTPFLAGDRLSLADTTLIGVARWAQFHQAVDGSAYPKLAALRRRIEAEPVVQYALAIEDGERPAGFGACVGHLPLAEVISRFAA
ncbi:glutathione S-transferase family protein [Pararhizobium sp. YC-54]|uniref:glutathione S-transferase family protein n=1 Tax=Pararhizobium sp. YC-54 TaxID=2986920 RepID=UPI0021F6B740|nr:glutathione S-transferase family protein [Pararhizobium sp. YC-54]MCV9999978.1 glutathione S-transferase family protein [Pararhizobium sp. YC-54]